MTLEVQTLTPQDLAVLFGTDSTDVHTLCQDVLTSTNLRYRQLTGPERDRVILTVLKKIFDPELPSAGSQRQPDWECGWQENLDLFRSSDGDLSTLVPKYFKKRVPARLDGQWVIGDDDDFVFALTHVYRTWLFRRYFYSMSAIAEFGCGPAYHLAYLAKLYPQRPLFGYDWAPSSVQIVSELAQRFGWPLHGGRFDFFNPDLSVHLPPNTGVLTFGALEQAGANHEPFLNFLLNQRPSLVVNVECLHELYDEENLADYVALAYHRRRNYLSGYLTCLKQLEAAGQIEIIKCHHFRFGNINDDPLSHVIWRPKVM